MKIMKMKFKTKITLKNLIDNSNENWKSIKDFVDYHISDKGNIISTKNNNAKYISPAINGAGYYYVCIRRNNKYYNKLVHRLVAETFLDNKYNLPEVNHKDENKLNNSVDNLEWCTSAYNNKYSSTAEYAREKNKIKVIRTDVNGKEVIFSSIKEAARNSNLSDFGVKYGAKHNTMVKGKYKFELII